MLEVFGFVSLIIAVATGTLDFLASVPVRSDALFLVMFAIACFLGDIAYSLKNR